ncbi:MAG: type II toxin-antitoxin system RelE/ParE family toxin [Gammaproteobacteria bacterium]|nr:type II toxin-antitoxin system RelE/ParE family toxin [Gammaproteobacteria bacterium]
MSYRFHPAAEAEHLEVVAFYESRRPGLGIAYLNEFEQVMTHVAQTPHRYRIERKPDIRRVSLVRFPFKLIFRDIGDSVQVLAVSHKRRRPEYWIGRLQSHAAAGSP